MITLQNHNDKIKSIDLSNAPEPIKKGKELFEKSAKFYDKSDAIKKTIDLYIAKLNEYAAKDATKAEAKNEPTPKVEKPKAETKATPKATKPKVEPKKVVKSEPKPKVKKASTKTTKAPCKPKIKIVKVKPKKAAVTRTVKSIELQLLNRYNNMNGKKILKAGLVKFSNDIKKAFENDYLTDHSTLLKEIRTNVNNAIEKMTEAKATFIDVSLNSVIAAKVQSILDTPTLKLRVDYLGSTDGLGK